MADEHNIKTFTAADIEKYHKGLLSSKERHAIEKAALDDPFLADALEGYSSASVNVNDDIAELKHRLTRRTEETKVIPVLPGKATSFSWWRAAAMIILVAGAGLLVYQLSFNNKSNTIAETNKQKVPAIETKDSGSAAASATVSADSEAKTVTPALQEKKEVDKKNGPVNNTLASKESTTQPVTEKETAGLARNDDADKPVALAGETVKSAPVEAKEALAKNAIPQKRNALSKQEESKEKNLKNDPVSLSEIEYKKTESRQPAARNANEGFYNQTNIFRGRVTDANNNALPFSNITNLEDKVGTYTDARGYFTLTSPDSVLNVQIRSLGFETNNVQLVNTKPENKILLEEDRTLSARVLDTVKRNTNRSRTTTMTLEEPEPLDGWSNYDTYLVNNLKVPESLRTRQGGGEVELSFEVDKNGEPVNIIVKKSLCDSCDKEAIRLIKEGPKWKRKVKKGKATVTVTF